MISTQAGEAQLTRDLGAASMGFWIWLATTAAVVALLAFIVTRLLVAARLVGPSKH